MRTEASVDTTSSDLLARCRSLEGRGLRTFVDPDPLTWKRAEGSSVEDVDGRRYLDLYGGYAVATLGHRHPRVVAAIRAQVDRLLHAPSAHPSPVRVEFYEALAGIAPTGMDRVLPAVTGAMANEIAIAIARTARPGRVVVAFEGGYLGRSLGVVGLAGKARYREALGVDRSASIIPFPYPFRMGDQALGVAMDALDDVAKREGPPAAVVAEPIQGNGGVVVPPAEFLPAVREFCDRTRALLILDEIQAGFGRTGRVWAAEHWAVVPDLMTVGKGIGGGMPIAAVLGRATSMTWEPDTFTSTFLTNPVSLAAATAAIESFRDERLWERAAGLEPLVLGALRDRLVGVHGIGEVRGIGLWAGIEIVDTRGGPDPGAAARIVRATRDKGVLVGRGGHSENVVKLSPPLVIGEEELATGVATVVTCIRRVLEEGS